jgi:hypothetical protein
MKACHEQLKLRLRIDAVDFLQYALQALYSKISIPHYRLVWGPTFILPFPKFILPFGPGPDFILSFPATAAIFHFLTEKVKRIIYHITFWSGGQLSYNLPFGLVSKFYITVREIFASGDYRVSCTPPLNTCTYGDLNILVFVYLCT